jgi:hypothetical protein
MYTAVRKDPEWEPAKKGARRSLKLKTVGFEWNDQARTSFEYIKESILNNACYGGDPSIQYHLATDPSDYAYGGVLFQIPGCPAGTVFNKTLVPEMQIVQFISKKFLDAETRYHTTEREALAVVHGLQEARWLINEGVHQVIVYTDHEALLSALKKSDNLTGRIVGWQLKLSEFDLKIVYVKGKENTLADGMSRLPARWIPQGGPWKEDSCLDVMALSEAGEELARGRREKRRVWKEWIEDEWYGGVVWFRLFNEVRDGEKSLSRWKWWARKAANFRLIGDPKDPQLTYVERDGKQSWCVRSPDVNKALTWAHDCHGHFAGAMTVRQLKGKYYWPSRHTDALKFCRACPNCQFIAPKLPSQEIKPVLHLSPMDLIGMDFLGPISRSAPPDANMCSSR